MLKFSTNVSVPFLIHAVMRSGGLITINLIRMKEDIMEKYYCELHSFLDGDENCPDCKSGRVETAVNSIPMQAGVMQKAMVIWVTYDEYGNLEKEFIYPEEEESKMPYQCEKYLMYNKNKTAKRLSCFFA